MNLIEFLLWLGGPAGIIALAWLSSRVLSKLPAFEAMSANAKTIVSHVIAVSIGVLGAAVAKELTRFPELLIQLEPYWVIVMAGAAVVAQQLGHGDAKIAGGSANG